MTGFTRALWLRFVAFAGLGAGLIVTAAYFLAHRNWQDRATAAHRRRERHRLTRQLRLSPPPRSPPPPPPPLPPVVPAATVPPIAAAKRKTAWQNLTDVQWAAQAAAELTADNSSRPAFADNVPVRVEVFIIAANIYSGGVCVNLDSAAAQGLSVTILGFGGVNRGGCVGCGKGLLLLPALRRLAETRPEGTLALLADAADVIFAGGAAAIAAGWRRLGSPRRAVLSAEVDLWETQGATREDFATAEGRDPAADQKLAQDYKLFRFPNTGMWLGPPASVAAALYASLGDTLTPNPTSEGAWAETHDQQAVIKRWRTKQLPRWILLDRKAEVFQSVFVFNPPIGNAVPGLWSKGSPPVQCGQFQFPMRKGMYACCIAKVPMQPWPPENGFTGTRPSVLHYNGPGKRMMISSLPPGYPPPLGGRPANGTGAAQVRLVAPPGAAAVAAERIVPLAEVCPVWASRKTCTFKVGRVKGKRKPRR
eukprot:TRINITY_DN14333_c0_g1_i1.p1 TRINITY_DN14333_c0_g1~~TRINITY_DN14333_c0_g1_i1.p1  ORF type:complete len:479 (+),score=52.20 TRINITY_DN14333_c0_g1_i1:92-1528(+)